MNATLRILILVLLKTVFLAGMIAWHGVVLHTGTPVLLRTEPLDPRDFFRGDYVILTYEISRIDMNGIATDAERFRDGQRIYVLLEPDAEDGYWTARAVSAKRGRAPEDAVWLRGRVTHALNHVAREPDGPHAPAQRRLWVAYGIESYFVPEGTGRDLEDLREQQRLGIEVAVSHLTGRGVIRAVLIDGERVYEEGLLR
jgi:uncharacterized membrane-anchored protein